MLLLYLAKCKTHATDKSLAVSVKKLIVLEKSFLSLFRHILEAQTVIQYAANTSFYLLHLACSANLPKGLY